MRVLVTGGTRGIGYEVARALSSSGMGVWICGRGEGLESAVESIGGQVRGSVLDVGTAESVDRLFAEIHDAWGNLDGVVHSAAVLGPSGPFWLMDSPSFAETVRVDVLGAFHVTSAFVRSRLTNHASASSRRGKVVLFAGGGAGYGYPKFLPYGTSKVGVVRMCETMDMELTEAAIPVDVNVMSPGANETSMLQAIRVAGAEVRTLVPFSKPIALCRWLLSEASDGISGRFIHVSDTFADWHAGALADDALKLRRVDA